MCADFVPLYSGARINGDVSPSSNRKCNGCVWAILIAASLCVVLLTLAALVMGALFAVYALPHIRAGGGVGAVFDKYFAVAEAVLSANITDVSRDVQSFYAGVMPVLELVRQLNLTALEQAVINAGGEGLLLTKKVLFNSYALCKVTHELDYQTACANAQDSNGQ